MLTKNKKKGTSANSPKSSKSKASVSIANSRTRRTLYMPFPVSSNSTDTKSSRLSDKLLAPDALLRKRLTQGEHWPIETTKTEPR